MPVITVTQADLMKTKTIEAGIYGAHIIKVYALENAKSGNGVNQRIDFEIEGANGKVIQAVFNSQLLGKIVPLFEAALGVKFEPGQLDTDQLQGKKVDVRIGTKTYEGNLMNEIQDYFPHGRGKQLNTTPF